MNQEFHFEHGDLSGDISIHLKEGQTLHDLFGKYVYEYSRERFEPISMRIFVGKETIVTLYAIDKLREDSSQVPADKIAVRKFKIGNIPLEELFSCMASFNCTLTTNSYPLDAMYVMNK